MLKAKVVIYKVANLAAAHTVSREVAPSVQGMTEQGRQNRWAHLCSCSGVRELQSLRRLISLQTVMRCRGVRVMSRDGQLLSQKPHSMQRSTSGLAGGEGFRNFRWAAGSCT